MKYWEYITNGMRDDSDGAIPYPIDTSTINSSNSNDDYNSDSYSQSNNVANDSSPNSDTGDFVDTYDIFKKDDDTNNSNKDTDKLYKMSKDSRDNADSGFWGNIRKFSDKLNTGFDELLKSNLVTEGLARAGQSAANAIIPGGALTDETYDTGNNIANGAADIIGTGLGFMEKLPGLDYSTGDILNKTIGTPVENTLKDIGSNYGLDNKLYDYATQALKTGTEFGGYEGLSNAIQGKDIGEGVAEGMGTGMLFGAGGKLAGDLFHMIPGIGKVKPIADDGNRITFQDENGNIQDMNKTIYDNTAQVNDTIGNKLNTEQFTPKTENINNKTNPLTDEEINKLVNGEDSIYNDTQIPSMPDFSLNTKNNLSGQQAQLFNIYSSNLKNIAEENNLNLNDFYKTTKDVNAYNPTFDDADLITSEFEKMFKNSPDKNATGYIQSLKKIVNANKPLENKIETNDMPLPTKSFKVSNSNIELPNLKDNETEIPINDIIRDDFNPETAPTQKIVSSNQNQGSLKERAKQKKEAFLMHTFDTNLPLKRVNENTYIKGTNSANSGGIVNRILKDSLVDASGNKIGDSLANVIKDIPKKESNDFWEYALQRHNIARAAENKPIYSRDVNGEQQPYTSAESSERVKYLEQQHPEWKQKADNVTNWIDKFMNEWGVNSGILNEDLYKANRQLYPDYIPTNRSFNDLEDFSSGSGNSRGFVDQRTPIRRATGSQRDITDPTENIMNLVNRTVRTAKMNKVGQEMLNTIRQDPEGLKSLAEIIPEEAMPKTKTDNIVTVLENGNPVNLKINDKNLLGSLKNLNKYSADDIDNAVKKVMGGFKSLITTKNPFFAIANASRDLPTYLINSKANPAKALWNLGGAYKDILTKSDVYNQYKGLGGGSENFFNSEKAYKAAKDLNPGIGKKALNLIPNLIENFNGLSESAPRLAEFKNTLKKTNDPEQAIYDAAEVTTNFAKSGDWTKKVDNYVPYLNAGVQGLSNVVRQTYNHPIKTAASGLSMVTLPALFNDYMNKDNPKYKELDNRTKDNYYLIPYGSEGKFIKIPKPREYGSAFAALPERIMRSKEGDKEAFKGLGTTFATNFSPTNPFENNIASPYFNLKSNKDFANRTIVPENMKDRSPKYQYDEKTSTLAKSLGEKFNLSPKQIDYLVKSYTGVGGEMVLPMLTPSSKTGSTVGDFISPLTSRFTADPLYSNQNLTNFYDNIDKIKNQKADEAFLNGTGKDDKTKTKYLESELSNASKKITEFSQDAFKAIQNGDLDGARAARQKMVDLAREENKYIPLPGQNTDDLPMPSTELNQNIKDALYKKTSNEAKQLRDATKGVYENYDLSTEDKTQQLQDLLNQAQAAPQKNPPKTNRKYTPRKKKKK